MKKDKVSNFKKVSYVVVVQKKCCFHLHWVEEWDVEHEDGEEGLQQEADLCQVPQLFQYRFEAKYYCFAKPSYLTILVFHEKSAHFAMYIFKIMQN